MTRSSADAVMADSPSGARPTIGDAWRRSGSTVRATALTAAAAGLAMALSGHVPVASGLAVTVLVPAALIDVHHRRLPNRWVAAAALTFVAAVLIGLGVGDGSDVGGAGLGMIALAGPLLVLHVVSPTSMGFGDVKAAAVLGACLGVIDWQLALAGLALAAGLTSVVAIVRHRSVVAFGPGLVAGALIALAAHSILLDTPDRSSSEAGTALERPTNGEQPT